MSEMMTASILVGLVNIGLAAALLRILATELPVTFVIIAHERLGGPSPTTPHGSLVVPRPDRGHPPRADRPCRSGNLQCRSRRGPGLVAIPQPRELHRLRRGPGSRGQLAGLVVPEPPGHDSHRLFAGIQPNEHRPIEIRWKSVSGERVSTGSRTEPHVPA